MNKSELSKMAILDQNALQKAENGIFVVDKNYNLNGASLIAPRGISLRFENGSITNGTLILNDNLLEGLEKGCLDVCIEGTLRNETIYTSLLPNGINSLANINLTGKTIYCDVNNEVLNNTIILNTTNTSLTTVFDGMGNSFTCNVTFFQIYGQSHITIRNFNAVANVSNIVFEEMITTSSDVIDVQVYNNTVDGFKIGISLNNDSADYTVSYSLVSNNHVYNCHGTTAGNGYGIHMANARHCTISGNEVVNCERHAIYHAYGENNSIINNIIRNHCQNITAYNLLAALEIGRKSKNVTVSGNTFINCNNICLLVYSPLPINDGQQAATQYAFRYGKCENIVIDNNSFDRGTLTGAIGNLPFIYIGVEGTSYSTLSTAGTVVVDVKILNNTFRKYGGENQKCIKIHQCEDLTIQGNNFKLGLPSSPQSSEYLVIHIPNSYINGNVCDMKIRNNIFSYHTTGVGNLYLMGQNMALINSTNSPYYIIKWITNILQNQTIGGVTMYQLSYNTPGNNFHYIT